MTARLLDWRLWLAWTLAALSTASAVAVFGFVGTVNDVQQKLTDRSTQSICLARVQGDFDRHVSLLIVASIDRDAATIAAERAELQRVAGRYERIESECPSE